MLIALDVADQRSDYERARLLLVASQVVYFQKEAPVGDGTSVPTFSLSDFLGATTPPPPTPPTLPPPALPSPGQGAYSCVCVCFLCGPLAGDVNSHAFCTQSSGGAPHLRS